MTIRFAKWAVDTAVWFGSVTGLAQSEEPKLKLGGAQAQYHLSPSGQVDPCVGLGAGYEILKLNSQLNANADAVTFKVLEFVNLQGGADFRVATGFTVGPFVGVSLAHYSRLSTPVFSGDIERKALHEWLTSAPRARSDYKVADRGSGEASAARDRHLRHSPGARRRKLAD